MRAKAKDAVKNEVKEVVSQVLTQNTDILPDWVSSDSCSIAEKVQDTSMAIGGITGDVDKSDISIPRLSLVQGIGDLSEEFDSGDFVYDKNTLLCKPGIALLVTVLSIRKYYEEDIPYDPDAPMADRYYSKQEAEAAGHTIGWVNDTRPTVRTCASLTLLIEMPNEVDDTLFPIEIQGKKYTPAVFTVKNKSYSTTAKPIFSALSFFLKKGLLYGEWQLFSAKERGKFTYQISKLKTIGRHDEEWVSTAKSMFDGEV